MTPLRIIPTALFSLLLLAGCQSPAPHADDVFPGGTRIRLERPLTIPADSATVRLQFGHVVASNAVQETEPYCIFEVNDVGTTPNTVAAGEFQVVAVERRVQDFSGMPMSPYMNPLAGWGRDSPSQMYFITRFQLHSAQQPGVRSLSCQSNQINIGSRHFLGLGEMRQAVGSYFSWQLPH